MAAVSPISAFDGSAVLGEFGTLLNASLIREVWRCVGTEVAIFAASLFFAILIRTFGAGGKKAQGGKVVAVTSKVPVVAVTAALPAPTTPSTPLQCATPSRRPLQVRSRSPAQALDDIVLSMRDEPSLRAAGRALQVYHEEVRSALRSEEGVHLQEIARFSRSSPLDLYMTLTNCAVRTGRYHLVEPLIEDMTEQGVHRPLIFYESAMKQLAGQKQYHLALAVYNRLSEDGLQASAITLSCLVGFAAEVGELQRAVEFFDSLSSMATPSIRAYMTLLRVHAKRQDFKASVTTLRDMDRRGVGMDSLALNVVLATGLAANQMEAVAGLLSEAGRSRPPISDVVSYNTLVKGYAQRGNAVGALKAIEQMRGIGLAPNAITFNTAMDAAVRGGDLGVAWRLLADLHQSGLRWDKFTCSILVKGLAKGPTESRVQDVLRLLEDVDGSLDGSLRTTLYHAVLDATSKSIKGGGALGATWQARVFAQMRARGVQPSTAAQRLMVQALPNAGEE